MSQKREGERERGRANSQRKKKDLKERFKGKREKG
jgi:hypothetical protein